MFSEETYRARRGRLFEAIDDGLALLVGNPESPINFAANVYPFRQDSTFLYYTGLDRPDLALVLDGASGTATLFGNDPGEDAAVWTVPGPDAEALAERCGADGAATLAQLAEGMARARGAGRTVHFTPPYRAETEALIADLTGLAAGGVAAATSEPLTRAVIAQRSVKSEDEVAEIEAAIEISRAMHLAAMKACQPGAGEAEALAAAEAEVARRGSQTSFPTILSVRGEVLHNPHHNNVMEAGQLVVHDSGAESPLGYASDITRTIPVSGCFEPEQRAVYDTVLRATEAVIDGVRPGVLYRDLHRLAAEVLMAGLNDLGVTRGDPAEAVAAGAHTQFFPCGVGHMLGLDVHDMEALGEDWVGYTDEVVRDPAFGWRSLRLGKALQPNYVITVEPGIYFNPVLIDRWRASGRCADFIDFDALERFRGFGGVRIEEDVLVTDDGARVLGPPIPRAAEEVEAACGG